MLKNIEDDLLLYKSKNKSNRFKDLFELIEYWKSKNIDQIDLLLSLNTILYHDDDDDDEYVETLPDLLDIISGWGRSKTPWGNDYEEVKKLLKLRGESW